MPTKAYALYHTDGCHLCELAMALAEQAQLDFALVDICEDTALAARYGTRIPVIADSATGKEIGWPFTLSQLEDFIGD